MRKISGDKVIDLHTHTVNSDGSYTPTQLIKLANDMKISAIAITDHDTFDGVEDAMIEAKQYGIEVIPGIEITAHYKTEVHILAYFFSSEFLKLQSWLIDKQDEFVRSIAAIKASRVNRASTAKKQKGTNCFLQKLKKQALMDSELVPQRPPAEEVIMVVREVGGIPILAHPFKYGFGRAQLEKFIFELKENGLMGIEVYHSDADSKQVEFLEGIVKKYDLLATGGSDYHGALKPNIELGIGRGNLKVSYELLEELRGHQSGRIGIF